MKKYLLILIAFVVFCANVQSQAPQRFNYQVIARDSDGNPLLNQSVNFRISLLQGSEAGPALYVETHARITNDFGQVTMAIGDGTVIMGVFGDISWGTDSYYVRTELDPIGGTSFSWVGTTQLLSVPYALYSNSSGIGGTTYAAGTGIDITGSTISNTMPNAIHSGDVVGGDELTVVRIQGRDVFAPYPTNGQTLIWNHTTNAWVPSFDGLLPSGTSGQTLHHDGTNWIANSLLFNNNTNIGIGTTTPTALLHTEGVGSGKGNVLFEGDFDQYTYGGAPTEGAGTRMMWYPDKAAFRAGIVDGTQWNTGYIGLNSIACGSNNMASGNSSTAFGHENMAWGNYSFATGAFTTAGGDYSGSSGYQTFAVGDYSSAFGYQSTAIGNAAMAMGYLTNASGNYSTALGERTLAPSFSETAIGCYNTFYYPSTNGGITFNSNDRLFNIGNGTGEFSRSNAMTVLKNGNTGFGTDFPEAQLHTTGTLRFEGAGTPGSGKVLTSDEMGNATWQTISGGGSLPSGFAGQTLRHDGSTWIANSLLFNDNTNIGIGTATPTAQLHTSGSVKFEGAGTPGEGKVLTSDASGNATWKGYSVGDYAQGGIIFWLDETGQHGLVACKFDQSPFSKWYAGTYGATRATGDGPLSGELNTGIIISSHVAIGDDGSLYAARICADVKLGEGTKTYGDWYLPTLNELWEMYMNRDLINTVAIANGGTAISGEYWSSTEFDSNTAWKLSFTGGAYLQSDKAEQNRVRAIRAF